jgi:hypothetical protein
MQASMPTVLQIERFRLSIAASSGSSRANRGLFDKQRRYVRPTPGMTEAPAMSDCDADVLLWYEHQANLLRRLAAGERVNDRIGWENVIEEVESVGSE